MLLQDLPQDTLLNQLNALLSGTVILVNGVSAQLTRFIYITPYANDTNYQQFVPLLYFNVIENRIDISNTADISFNTNDIFVADDWVILNQVVV